jgi:rSAM/selenodomain-associated transferase 2
MSVVIPTLDAAEELPGALAALAGSRIAREVIVSDGGSRDGTVTIAKAVGARVLVGSCGRGTQLIAGAEAATAGWLLFLHADCRLARGWEEAVIDFISQPGAAERAGYFRLTLDDAVPAARRLERVVAWRCRALALPYGDQGLLIARSLYDAVGGFAPIPLMEDVECMRRLGRRRLAPIEARIIASARRYRREGYWRRPLRNLVCLSLFFLGVPPARIARLYG